MLQRHPCYHYTIPDQHIYFSICRRAVQEHLLALGQKNCAHQDLPFDKSPDGLFLQAGLAVFALSVGKQKHRCAFQVLPCTKQLVHLDKKTAPIRT